MSSSIPWRKLLALDSNTEKKGGGGGGIKLSRLHVQDKKGDLARASQPSFVPLDTPCTPLLKRHRHAQIQ